MAQSGKFPTNEEVDISSADTEVSVVVPESVNRILFRNRDGASGADVRYSWVQGEVADGSGGKFSTLFAGESRNISDLNLKGTSGGQRTLYLASSTGSQVIEIEYFKS